MDSSNICVLCEHARMRDDVCGIYCVGEYWKNDDGTCGHFKEHKEATMNNNALADASGWISVKDRLPEPKEKAICLNRHGDMMIGTYTEWGWMFPCYYDKPTHWMSLPEPPKEGTT